MVPECGGSYKGGSGWNEVRRCSSGLAGSCLEPEAGPLEPPAPPGPQVVKNDLSPTWQPFKVSLSSLCSCEESRPLKVGGALRLEDGGVAGKGAGRAVGWGQPHETTPSWS